MPDILPQLLSQWDENKARAIRQVSEALSNPIEWGSRNFAAQSEKNREMSDYLRTLPPEEQMKRLTAGAQGGGLEMAAGPARAGTAIAGELRAQLAPYQQALFDRFLLATKDPQLAFSETRRMTNLMSPSPPTLPSLP